MWFSWYFLLIFALFGSTLPMIWIANKLNSEIQSGNYRAALLKALLVTVAALTAWVCLLLQPFNLTNIKHHWSIYLAALLVTVKVVEEWHKVSRFRCQKHTEQTADDAKMR